MSAKAAIPTASLRTLRPLALGLKARGVDIVPVFTAGGVDPEALSDPDARVPAAETHALWAEAERLCGDRFFGVHTAQLIRPGSFDVLDYVCRNCATVGAGLQLYCRYTPLLHDQIVASVDAASESAWLRHVLDDGSVLPRQYAEFIIASLLVIVRQASGVDVVPRGVSFLHAEPADTSELHTFFRCPIEFDATHNGMELSRADFDRPLLQAQPGLLEVLERHAEHLLQKSSRPSGLVAQVRASIVSQLKAGSVSAGGVAKSLAMSERTLRRRLDAEDTTYQRLLDEVRTELATRYLEERQIAIDEVALLLGFSDRSSFVRAFRQWTGRTPADFRQQRAS